MAPPGRPGRASLPRRQAGRARPRSSCSVALIGSAGAPRRLLAFFIGNEELRALATCGGFFLQVADPKAAAAAVHAAGLNPPLTLAEATRLDDLAAERGFRGRDR